MVKLTLSLNFVSIKIFLKVVRLKRILLKYISYMLLSVQNILIYFVCMGHSWTMMHLCGGQKTTCKKFTMLGQGSSV